MKNTKTRMLAFLLAFALVMAIVPLSAINAIASTTTEITNLKTSGLENPLGIDDATPTFSWQMESNVIGAEQSSYQILVKKASDDTVVWDSGKVVSSDSTYIYYAGKELESQTTYTWTVTVVDQNGNEVTSDEATFETALMDTTLASWTDNSGNTAKWIGADELTLDATAACYFDLSMDLQIPDGSTNASVIFGANDFRLAESTYNIWRSGTENNYYKYEIDVTDPDNAKLNIYVVGMPINGQDEENAADVADVTVNISSDIINSSNAHDRMTIRITTTTSNINQVSCLINGTSVDSNRQLNPLGRTHDYNSFPNLNSIGFAVPAGQTAYYSNITVENPGIYSEGTLFAQNIGAKYDIFNGLSNVSVDDASGIITVNGGASEGTLQYADPSYGSAPMLRTEFATKTVESARLYITAQGIYNAYINGESVSDEWFNPGNSEYRERISYQTYDVTDMLNSNGDNAIGIQLGEGWWSGYQTYTASNYNYYGEKQAALVKMDITYTDGTTETIISDLDTWEYYGEGTVEYGSFYQGERYNALKEAAVEGWATASYDSSAWRSATEITTKEAFSNYILETRLEDAATVVNELGAAASLGEAREGSGVYIYDMGENVIGVPEITIPAEYVDEGSEITIRYAEILYPNLEEYVADDINGLLMVENLRAALVTDFYTAKAGDQVIAPSYTFHGYRYIEISGLKSELPKEYIKTLVLSSVEMTSTYDSSNTLATRLFKNVQNSQTSNFLSLPTDCPQRNERMGWTGDAQVFSTAATYNADVYNFYRQWLKSLRDEQGADGSLPVTAPSFGTVNSDGTVTTGNTGGFAGVSWDAAIANIPYNLYMQYGDTQIIEENIDTIYNYLNFLDNNDMTVGSSTIPELTSKTGVLADWLSRVSTNATLINNAVYIYLTGISAEMAEIVGKTDMAAELQARYDAAKAVWNELYVDPDTGQTRYPSSYDADTNTYTYASQNTQASYATALRYGIFSEANEEKAVENYVLTVTNPDEYTDSNGAVQAYTITTGFSGTPNLVPVLSNYGYTEEAYALFESTEYASWLYPVTQGATSVWERWNSYTTTNGFGGNNSMNSFNHFALGAISEWMMSTQLGITTGDSAGYQNFVLQPTVGGSFTYANGSFDSTYGTIYSGWTATGTGTAEDNGVGATSYNELTSYTTVVPANTTATLYLPVESVGELTLPEAGVTYVGMTTNNGITVAEFTLSAGGYEFSVTDDGITVKISEGYEVFSDASSSDSSVDPSTDPSGESSSDPSGESSTGTSSDSSTDISDTPSKDTSVDSSSQSTGSITTSTGGSTSTASKGKTSSAKTGDYSGVGIMLAAMVVSGVAVVAIKRRSNSK